MADFPARLQSTALRAHPAHAWLARVSGALARVHICRSYLPAQAALLADRIRDKDEGGGDLPSADAPAPQPRKWWALG